MDQLLPAYSWILAQQKHTYAFHPCSESRFAAGELQARRVQTSTWPWHQQDGDALPGRLLKRKGVQCSKLQQHVTMRAKPAQNENSRVPRRLAAGFATGADPCGEVVGMHPP